MEYSLNIYPTNLRLLADFFPFTSKTSNTISNYNKSKYIKKKTDFISFGKATVSSVICIVKNYSYLFKLKEVFKEYLMKVFFDVYHNQRKKLN